MDQVQTVSKTINTEKLRNGNQAKTKLSLKFAKQQTGARTAMETARVQNNSSIGK